MRRLKKVNHPITRADFGRLLAERHKLGPAVEVGVYKGEYAEQILSWGVEMLYLIDLWEHVPQGRAELSMSNEELEAVYEACMLRVKKYGSKVRVLRGWSSEMCHYIPDDSCDFIFIDATHEYASVMSDLRAYWPKLRAGGMMAGHDYTSMFTVREAVNDFAMINDLTVNTAPVNQNDVSFWLDKVS